MHFCAFLTVICQPIPVNRGAAAPLPLNPPLAEMLLECLLAGFVLCFKSVQLQYVEKYHKIILSCYDHKRVYVILTLEQMFHHKCGWYSPSGEIV